MQTRISTGRRTQRRHKHRSPCTGGGKRPTIDDVNSDTSVSICKSSNRKQAVTNEASANASRESDGFQVWHTLHKLPQRRREPLCAVSEVVKVAGSGGPAGMQLRVHHCKHGRIVVTTPIHNTHRSESSPVFRRHKPVARRTTATVGVGPGVLVLNQLGPVGKDR